MFREFFGIHQSQSTDHDNETMTKQEWRRATLLALLGAVLTFLVFWWLLSNAAQGAAFYAQIFAVSFGINLYLFFTHVPKKAAVATSPRQHSGVTTTSWGECDLRYPPEHGAVRAAARCVLAAARILKGLGATLAG